MHVAIVFAVLVGGAPTWKPFAPPAWLRGSTPRDADREAANGADSARQRRTADLHDLP